MGASQNIRKNGSATLDYARIATFQVNFMANIGKLKCALGKWARNRLFRFLVFEIGQDLRVSEYVASFPFFPCNFPHLCSSALVPRSLSARPSRTSSLQVSIARVSST